MKNILRKIFSTSFDIQLIHSLLLMLRIGVSALMLTHGLPKLSKLIEGNLQFPDPLGIGMASSLVLAVFAEAICSFLILFGVATRIATIPLIITMATAAFVVHLEDPFNKKELPILYILIYLTILILGSGKFAIDNWIHKKL
ncbi:MAG: DoxX family protein [Bacteroidota bacterium]|nr:DoxX family protein [Bacteroidota bacterium]